MGLEPIRETPVRVRLQDGLRDEEHDEPGDDD
jgi:hypothetical protein